MELVTIESKLDYKSFF